MPNQKLKTMKNKEQRYIISVPFYAEDMNDVNVAMDKIAEAIEVPYISVSVQDQDHVITFLQSREYDGDEPRTFKASDLNLFLE